MRREHVYTLAAEAILERQAQCCCGGRGPADRRSFPHLPAVSSPIDSIGLEDCPAGRGNTAATR